VYLLGSRAILVLRMPERLVERRMEKRVLDYECKVHMYIYIYKEREREREREKR
jgi:hypothetical protein